MIKTMLQGFSMAMADSVPGVSGGTIAFILGYYENLIGALHDIAGKADVPKKNAVIYLLKFGTGWALSLAICVFVLSRLLENNIYILSSLFIGLSIAAIPFVVYEERNTMKNRYSHILFAVLGAAAVVALVMTRSAAVMPVTVNFCSPSVFQYVYLLASGAAAAAAMLMPGISGSTLLLILGIYAPAVSALKEVTHLNMQYLPGTAALALGAVLGIMFAARGIRRGLRRYRSQMMYLVIGMMAGSLYAIVMGPTTLEIPEPPVDLSSFCLPAFLAGVCILVGLELIKNRGVYRQKQ